MILQGMLHKKVFLKTTHIRSKLLVVSNTTMLLMVTTMEMRHIIIKKLKIIATMIINQMRFVTLRGQLSDASALAEQITTSTCSIQKVPKGKISYSKSSFGKKHSPMPEKPCIPS